MIQTQLDKKTKELQDMNEYTKKLLSNKDKLLLEYEEKIEEMTKDKNNLISQNKELLEKLKAKNEEASATTNLADIIDEDNKEELEHVMQENKLLNEEIKELKEQLNLQAKDLVDLNSLEKENVKLKAQNETLINDNKEIKKKLEEKINQKEQKDQNEQKDNTRLSIRNKNLINYTKSIIKSSFGRKGTFLEKNLEILNLEKQLSALKKIKEDEKKDYEEQLEKIKMELAMLKVQNLNIQYETNSLLAKYKNTIKSIANQCQKKGIKLSLNLVNIK